MHIVHCVFEMETGGSQVLVVDLLNEMCRHHTVSLIIINEQYNKSLLAQISDTVKIYYLRRKQHSYYPLPFIRLNQLLLRIRPDIVHCHEYNTAQFIWIKKGKLVNTVHCIGLPVRYYYRYHLLVAISQAVYNDVRSRCASPLTMIYNGIRIEAFKQPRAVAKPAVWRLVQLGRLVHSLKGHDVLLKALHMVIYEYGMTNISLDIIGSGESLEFLQSMVGELQLGQWVNFAGEKERGWLYDHLGEYHLMVHPSHFEGFGLSMIEGIAAGLPLLASNIFGPAEILPDIPAAFLFETDDVAGCARQIVYILSLYETGTLPALIEASIDLIERKYALHACAAAYLKTYEALAGQP